MPGGFCSGPGRGRRDDARARHLHATAARGIAAPVLRPPPGRGPVPDRPPRPRPRRGRLLPRHHLRRGRALAARDRSSARPPPRVRVPGTDARPPPSHSPPRRQGLLAIPRPRRCRGRSVRDRFAVRLGLRRKSRLPAPAAHRAAAALLQPARPPHEAVPGGRPQRGGGPRRARPRRLRPRRLLAGLRHPARHQREDRRLRGRALLHGGRALHHRLRRHHAPRQHLRRTALGGHDDRRHLAVLPPRAGGVPPRRQGAPPVPAVRPAAPRPRRRARRAAAC
jgi:hypothetical protein